MLSKSMFMAGLLAVGGFLFCTGCEETGYQGEKDFYSDDYYSYTEYSLEGRRIDAAAAEPFNRGQQQYRQKQYEAAIESYTVALKADPAFSQAYARRGAALMQLGKYDAAAADFRNSIRLSDKAATNQLLGQALIGLKQYEDAIPVLTHGTQLDPKDVQSQILLGYVLIRTNRTADAVAAYTRAIELDSHNERAVYGRGLALFALQKYAAAAVDLRTAIRLSDNAVANQLLGRALIHLERYDDAIPALTHALQLDPKDIDSQINLGYAFLRTHRGAEAVIAYNRAIELSPQNGKAFYGRGLAYASVNRFDDAVSDLEGARQLGQQFDERILSMVRDRVSDPLQVLASEKWLLEHVRLNPEWPLTEPATQPGVR